MLKRRRQDAGKLLWKDRLFFPVSVLLLFQLFLNIIQPQAQAGVIGIPIAAVRTARGQKVLAARQVHCVDMLAVFAFKAQSHAVLLLHAPVYHTTKPCKKSNRIF